MRTHRPKFKIGQRVVVVRVRTSYATYVVGESGDVIQIGQLRNGSYSYLIRARPSIHHEVEEANLGAAR